MSLLRTLRSKGHEVTFDFRVTRALSVRQPWASLIASGKKTIELRSWPTRVRGRIVIVSSLKAWKGYESDCGPRGVTLASVELFDVRPAVEADETDALIKPSEGFYAWLLRDVRQLEPIPLKGKLGIFNLPSNFELR